MPKNSLSGFNPLRYFAQVREELEKVTWPSRQQIIQKTMLVIAVSLGVGAYIGALDYFFTFIMQYIIK